MYHCFRSVVYFAHGGDDHEEHSVLSKHIPDDFPNNQLWENSLKDARARRNEADYSPYPRDSAMFRSDSDTIISTVCALMSVARAYLRRKGCAIK